jgi:hypothetical protein
MDRTATPSRRMANVEQGFERSRLSEEVLASAYERVLPLVRRSTRLPQEHSPTRLVERQLRQARRAS